MSCYLSKIDSISKLRLEPFPCKPTKIVKACRVGDRTIVALAENGTIHTNAVGARYAYSSCWDGRHGDVLEGCIKLGVLTAEAVKAHRDHQKERDDYQNKKWRAGALIEQAEILGIKLTKSQLIKLQPYTKVKKEIQES